MLMSGRSVGPPCELSLDAESIGQVAAAGVLPGWARACSRRAHPSWLLHAREFARTRRPCQEHLAVSLRLSCLAWIDVGRRCVRLSDDLTAGTKVALLRRTCGTWVGGVEALWISASAPCAGSVGVHQACGAWSRICQFFRSRFAPRFAPRFVPACAARGPPSTRGHPRRLRM